MCDYGGVEIYVVAEAVEFEKLSRVDGMLDGHRRFQTELTPGLVSHVLYAHAVHRHEVVAGDMLYRHLHVWLDCLGKTQSPPLVAVGACEVGEKQRIV